MIIAESSEATLEVNGNEILMHNYKENQLLTDYEEMRITLTKEQIKILIEKLNKC